MLTASIQQHASHPCKKNSRRLPFRFAFMYAMCEHKSKSLMTLVVKEVESKMGDFAL